jgi:hypothetical protein
MNSCGWRAHNLKNPKGRILKYCPALYALTEQEMVAVALKYQVHKIAIRL